MRDEFDNEVSADDLLEQLGDKVEELFQAVTDDPGLADDAKADVIQMMEEIQQYIEDARKITSASSDE